MARKTLTAAIKEGRILISDGAWGTFLLSKGLQIGECPELWCLERPDDVLDIAKAYVAAGSDIIGTNSFGGSRFKLEGYGLGERVREINQAAASLSRKAAGEDRWVMASMGPTGKILLMGEVTEEELYIAFKEQATALAAGGADALCIETMSAIDEAVIAVKAAKENTACQVICTFTFSKTLKGEYRTMMGVAPQEAAEAAVQAGADIIGTNCGNGAAGMVDIVKQMRAALSDVPLIVQANAGMPQNINGMDVFPETPEVMASYVEQLIEAGANIIGGCCGTTPGHIKAIKAAALRVGNTGR
ncbi:MAG TPA: methionine synthase [Firmicutes bacterium]|nr:methionine synthase [Bacillota bacterium]